MNFPRKLFLVCILGKKQSIQAIERKMDIQMQHLSKKKRGIEILFSKFGRALLNIIMFPLALKCQRELIRSTTIFWQQMNFALEENENYFRWSKTTSHFYYFNKNTKATFLGIRADFRWQKPLLNLSKFSPVLTCARALLYM